MESKILLNTALFSLLMCVSVPAQTHDLTLDKRGCHQDGVYGKYHCHEGEFAGEVFVAREDYPGYKKEAVKIARVSLKQPIKMNSLGFCIAPDSVVYRVQKKYRVFRSLEACLGAGGLPDNWNPAK